MVKQFLITRPSHDKETSYLYSFSKAIVEIAKQDKNLRLTELSKSQANRQNLESALNTKDKTLVFLNGHGDSETVLGHQDEPILDKQNIKLAKNNIVYALACDSLASLGKLSINQGVKAYIGYKNQFMWVGDPSKSTTPEKDKNSRPFRKVCHILINSLVTGNSVKSSITKTKHEYMDLIRNYGTSKDTFGDAPAIGFALAWNLSALDWEGEGEAVF